MSQSKLEMGLDPQEHKGEQYVSPLSEECLELARKELREDEHTREQALAAMREWIERSPHILRCRTDANYLLRFLRAKKFSLPLTQEAMTRYLLLRQAYCPAFQYLDHTLPVISELIDKGYIFAAPKRDHMGRRVIIYRPGVFNPYKHTNADMCRIHGVTYETLMEDEENQVRGFVHFADGAGVTLPYLTLFTPKEAVRIVKNGERTIPMRHKGVYGFNVHPSLKLAVDFGLSLVSEKIKSRIKVFTTLDQALGHIDRKLLPKEYGGDMPMTEMIGLWKGELRACRRQLLAHDNMQVNLEMFSEQARAGAVGALRAGNMLCGKKGGVGGNGSGGDIKGLSGSFRKLEVD